MDSIASRLEAIRSTLPEGVELCAVTKFHPVDALMQAYEAGQRVMGESRVQELLQKIPQMPADVRWHFIGHLQTNKVRQIIGKVAMIESVDTLKLLKLIDQESQRAGVVTNLLLQLHVAAEETKFGFSPDELLEYFRSGEYRQLRAVRLCGLMGMATNTDDRERIREDFRTIALTRQAIANAAPDLEHFTQLSMGMSDDYLIAIEEGATLVRIGTDIFGPRQY